MPSAGSQPRVSWCLPALLSPCSSAGSPGTAPGQRKAKEASATVPESSRDPGGCSELELGEEGGNCPGSAGGRSRGWPRAPRASSCICRGICSREGVLAGQRQLSSSAETSWTPPFTHIKPIKASGCRANNDTITHGGAAGTPTTPPCFSSRHLVRDFSKVHEVQQGLSHCCSRQWGPTAPLCPPVFSPGSRRRADGGDCTDSRHGFM